MNFSISVLAFFVAAFLVRPAAQAALHWANAKPFGLIHLVPLPAPLALVISFLLMDLAFYYWHIANHRIPFLWRFHGRPSHRSRSRCIHRLSISFWQSDGVGGVPRAAGQSDRALQLGICRLRTGFPSEHALSSQQSAASHPLRALVEQSTGDAAYARHSPLTSPAREQFKLRRRFPVVGSASSHTRSQHSTGGNCSRIAGYSLRDDNELGNGCSCPFASSAITGGGRMGVRLNAPRRSRDSRHLIWPSDG